jgi:hypothetical protein
MCDFVYKDINEKNCPRCRAPRIRLEQAKRVFMKTVSGKATRSRYMEPTSAFGNIAKVQQKMRRDIEGARGAVPTTWHTPSYQGNRRDKFLMPVDSDSDDEQRARSTVASTFSVRSKGSVRPKKTAGPDFADF